MADNAVSLEILVEVKESLKRLETFEKQAASSTSKIEKAFERVGEAALAYFAFEKIKDFFTESIKAAAEQEQGLARLSNAMALTGEYSKAAVADFEEFANTMQKTTKFGDDAVISQLSVAKSFGLSNDKAKELVKTAADLAAATGESLETAVHQLGITYSGTAGRLGQTIPILKTLTEEQLKAGDAVKILGERFGGSAAAEINTYGGAVQQSSNAFEDFQKAIGRVVTESPTVIARIQGMTKMWEKLEQFVKDNKEQLGEFVDFGIKALAVSGPVATEVLRILATAFQALSGTAILAIDGILEISSVMANGLRLSFGTVIDVLLSTASTVVEFAGKVPGAGTALKKLGVDTADLSTTIKGLKTSFDHTADGAVSAVEHARDGMVDFTVKTDSAFKSFDKGFDKFSKAVDGGAQAIFDAGEKTQASADKIKNSMTGAGQAAALTAEQIKKFREEAQKLREELAQNSTDEIGRISIAYKKQIDEIDKLSKISVKNGGIDAKEAANLRVQAEEILTGKIDKIRSDEADKAAKEAQDALSKQAQAYASYLSTVGQLGATETDQFKFQKDQQLAAVEKFEADATITHEEAMKARAAIDEDYHAKRAKLFSDDPFKAIGAGPLSGQDMAGLGVGLTTDALQGKAGATKLVSQGIGALGDAAGIPGLGQVAQLLAAGPEQTKAMVKAFVEAIPDIIQAISESIPVVVEVFVDTMVNKGGAVKIGIAIAKAMAGGPIWAAIGKQLGNGMEGHFDGAKVGRIMSAEFNANTIPDFLNSIQGAGDKLRLSTAEIPNKIESGFNNGANSASASILTAFDQAGKKLMEGINTVWLPIRDAIVGVGSALSFFFKSLSDLFSGIKFPEIKIPTPDWLKAFISAVNSINPGGKGGGKGLIAETLGFATGITEVPGGFPSDNFPARLTSGERVVDVDANRDLKEFLKDPAAANGPMIGLLAQILSALQQPVQQPVSIQIDSRNIADVILSLNKRSARLA